MSVGGKRGGGYLQVIPGLTTYPPSDICSCVGAANLSVRLLVRFFQWYPRPHTRIDAVTLPIRPLNYNPFVFLMQRAYLLLTDSGGVQEEAPALGKPVLVLRAKTERPEAVDARVVKVLGPDRDLIIDQAQRLLESRRPMPPRPGTCRPTLMARPEGAFGMFEALIPLGRPNHAMTSGEAPVPVRCPRHLLVRRTLVRGVVERS